MALGLSPVARADSWRDIEALISLITATGTEISRRSDCAEEYKGLYVFEPSKNIDLLVLCDNNINPEDPSDIWEVLSHEATHVMQACIGDTLFQEDMHPRILRELQTKAPHYYEILETSYHGGDYIIEAESFWMELQHPDLVLELFHTACFLEEK